MTIDTKVLGKLLLLRWLQNGANLGKLLLLRGL